MLEKVLRVLARYLRRSGDFDLSEYFIDGSFVEAKRGGAGVGKIKRSKGTKLMAAANGLGAPVASHITSASPHEVTLVEDTLAGRFIQCQSESMIRNRAHDSGPLNRRMAEMGYEYHVKNPISWASYI